MVKWPETNYKHCAPVSGKVDVQLVDAHLARDLVNSDACCENALNTAVG